MPDIPPFSCCISLCTPQSAALPARPLADPSFVSIESRTRTCPAECVSTVQFAVQPSLDRSSTASARHLRGLLRGGECRQGAPPPLQAVWLYACTAVRTQNHTHTRVRPHHSGAAPCHEELHHNRPASGNGHSSVRGLTAVSTADLLAPYMSTVHHFSVYPRLYFTCTAWKTHGSTACKNCVPQSAPPSQQATQLEVWVLCRWKFH